MYKKKIYFFSNLLHDTNYRSSLSRAIYPNGTIETNYPISYKIEGIQKFYNKYFETFCYLKNLDPIEELCIRKIELEDSELINPISLYTSVISGIVASIGFYLLTLFPKNIILTIFSCVIGILILIYGTIIVFYLYYRGKTIYPKRKILREFELKLVCRCLDDAIDKINNNS